jgi:SAM-dependent methyltransferase
VKIRSVVGKVAQSQPAFRMRQRMFPGSADYWEDRYAKGGTSGAGSYGRQAEWKASVVNRWVAELGVTSVVDLGCGDGNQLALAEYPRYLGLDRSATAVKLCIERFADDPTKSFLRYDPVTLADAAGWLRGDMAISLEVIFHLVEDEVFEDYMFRLFDSAERHVVICCNARDGGELGPTEKHRDFTRWIAEARPEWTLRERVDPPEGIHLISSFFRYGRDA